MGIFWEFFRRIFFEGISLEEYFGEIFVRIFLGGFFLEDFLGGI
jgi:hypothetical protein